jgi:hypothetical protein
MTLVMEDHLDMAQAHLEELSKVDSRTDTPARSLGWSVALRHPFPMAASASEAAHTGIQVLYGCGEPL